MEEDVEYEEEDYNDLMQAFHGGSTFADKPTRKDDKW